MFAGTLTSKRREARLALTWDPVERTGEPARCSLCDGLTYEVGLHRDWPHRLSAAEAVAALRSLGVAGDLRGRFRESHAFVGVKGAPAGMALEALGPRALTLVVGQPSEGLGFELESFALERGPR